MSYTNLILYENCPLDIEHEDTILFANTSIQELWFSQLTHIEYNDFLYVDYNKPIIVENSLGVNKNYNYLSYKNGDNNKIYYAFITNKQYLSDGSTAISFKIDVMQTFFIANTDIGGAYVARGHVDRMELSNGYYTPKESSRYAFLNGEYITDSISYEIDKKYRIADNNIVGWYVVNISESADAALDIHTFNNTPSISSIYFPVPTSSTYHINTYGKIGSGEVFEFLDLRVLSVVFDRFEVLSIKYTPYVPFNFSTSVSANTITVNFPNNEVYKTFRVNYAPSSEHLHEYFFVRPSIEWKQPYKTSRSIATNDMLDLPTSLGWSTNKLKSPNLEMKLKFYPYTYFELTDGTNSKPFYINDKNSFACNASGNIQIKTAGVIDSQCENTAYVFGFGTGNGDESIEQIKNNMTVCNNFNMFTTKSMLQQYLANKLGGDVVKGVVSSVGTMIVGAITENPMIVAAGGIGAVSSLGGVVGDTVNAALAPNTYSVPQCDLQKIAAGNAWYYFIRNTCHENIKDTAFTQFYNYGYTVNKYISNFKDFISSRYYFNYVKCKEVKILGTSEIDDSEFKKEIKEILMKGIRFWHPDVARFRYLNFEYENIERNLIT